MTKNKGRTVSLEFNQIIEPLHKMIYYKKKLSESQQDRLQTALRLFRTLAGDLDLVHERVKLARRPDVSGYRGAAPLDKPYDEIANAQITAQFMPDQAVIIAADGSQIYPGYEAPTLYYLINIGLFAFYHGQDRLPAQWTRPQLVYTEEMVKDSRQQLIGGRTVNSRRTVEEMRALGAAAWELRRADEGLTIALHDGNLLKFFGGDDIEDGVLLERAYIAALVQLHDAGALLAGYVDDPRSKYIISLLHLLSLEEHQVNDLFLQNDGALEGLTDEALLSRVLQPGERSALMAANSPQNRDFRKEYGISFEIAFFYMNVGDTFRPHIARVDVPMWVARDKRAVDALHSMLLAQCAIQGRRGYPYALTRADELAYVSGADKRQLDELIRINLRDMGIQPGEASGKMETKDLARGDLRQEFRLGG